MKILVADDDTVSRRILERLLCGAGYEVVTAGSGREALDRLLCDGGPRLALLDWMMPDLDGPDICLELRRHRERPYIYISLLTSREAKEDVIAGLEAGADDYLIKPCNPEELKARLRTGQRILRLEDSLVEAREEMRFKATHDPLTSLWNRGAILARLNQEIHRAQGQGTPFSVLLCDVDHFKRVNDEHGHSAGDAVLKEVAVRLRRAVRADDAVGRYGGEEFLVLLNDCGKANLLRRAEHLRQLVGSSAFLIGSGQLPVSISVGAMSVDGCKIGYTAEELLIQVDIALYRAKMEGRDRVVFAGPQPVARSGAAEKPVSSADGIEMAFA